MILLNNSSENTWPISTKFKVNPTVVTGLRVCSNGHAPSTVMPIYGKKMIIKNTFFFFKTKNCSNYDPFISCNDSIGKMLHNICISAVAVSLRWACRGPWASCYTSLLKPMGLLGSAEWKVVKMIMVHHTASVKYPCTVFTISIGTPQFLAITQTCLYNVDSLKPHFYVVKLGFTGVYIIFLISAQKHKLWVLVRTASPRQF